jgi:hypothetical protein
MAAYPRLLAGPPPGAPESHPAVRGCVKEAFHERAQWGMPGPSANGDGVGRGVGVAEELELEGGEAAMGRWGYGRPCPLCIPIALMCAGQVGKVVFGQVGKALASLGLGCGSTFSAGMKRVHEWPGRHTPLCVTNHTKSVDGHHTPPTPPWPPLHPCPQPPPPPPCRPVQGAGGGALRGF